MKRAKLLALAAVALSSCAVATQERAEVVADRDVPFGLLDRNAPPLVPTTVAGPENEEVQLWFIFEGSLVPVTRRLDRPVVPIDAVRALASPPTDVTNPPRTALTNLTIVRSVTVVGGVARVDLAPTITELGGEDQLLVVAQIVFTLTARPGVGQVTFSVEGTPTDVPRGDGSLVSQPVSREDYSTLLG